MDDVETHNAVMGAVVKALMTRLGVSELTLSFDEMDISSERDLIVRVHPDKTVRVHFKSN